MSLYYRLLRRLGKDTTKEVTHTETVKQYTVIHLDGETTEVIAHGYKTSGAFATFYVCDATFIAEISHYSIWPLRTDVRVLEGIREIECEAVGETTFRAVVDMADGETVSEEIEDGIPVEAVVA